MITKIQCAKLMIAGLTLLSLSASLVNAADKRPAAEVPIDGFIRETQQLNSNSESIAAVWWIPYEYWKVVLSQDKSISSARRESVLQTLQSVFIVGVVQADISPLGNFDFFSNKAIQKGLRVTYIDATGKALALKPAEKVSDDIGLLLEAVRPILSKAMGNLGQNFSFFVYNTLDSSGKRLVSPYEPGELKVLLGRRDGARRSEQIIELPIDSLFVPRRCPNGKPAHISWKYCPWDGSRLAN